MFVWEYLHSSQRGLASVPSRPVGFELAASRGVRRTCDGASDSFGFKDAGRVFQVEVYLGPEIGPALRGRVAAMLDSLRPTPHARPLTGFILPPPMGYVSAAAIRSSDSQALLRCWSEHPLGLGCRESMDALERFREAIASVGLQVPEQGYAESALSGLERELAPLRLPSELRDLWSRVEVGRIPLGPGIDVAQPFTRWFADLSLCRWLWRAIRDRPGLMPEALLPVVMYGGVVQLVELADDASTGGRVFEWRRGVAELAPCYRSIGEWLEVMADLVADESSRVLRLSEDSRWLAVSALREGELRHECDAASAERLVARDCGTWPQRWQAASRAFDDRRPQRPSELSVSQFLWDLPDSAMVAGVLKHTALPGKPARVHLADGTGWLDVWCSDALPGLWVTEYESAVEFEVIANVGAWPPPGVPDSEWFPYPPQATATCLRLRTFG